MLSFIKKALSVLLCFSLSFIFFGCVGKEEVPNRTPSAEITTATLPVSNPGADTTVLLNDSLTSVSGAGAEFRNGVLTVFEAGTYYISGKLSDGFIYVNTTDKEKKVKLIFDGVDIYSSVSSPVFVESSPKETQIILKDGSINNLSDNKNRVLSESEITSDDYSKAVVFSKDDLQIEGTGTLNITAAFEKGIFSKDDLQIKGCIINITAEDDGIRGKDSVEISDSTITVTAKADAIRSSNETDENKGDITVTNSTVNIESGLDGIQSVGKLFVSGCNISVTTAGGASEDMTSAPEYLRQRPGESGNRYDPFGEEQQKEENTESAKGLKSADDMTVSDSSITVNSVDDSLHSNKNFTAENSTIEVKTNDDGIHSELSLTLKNSTATVSLSYEGIEAQEITLEGSTADITSSDDGLNAALAEEQSENPAFAGGKDEKAPPEAPGIFSNRGEGNRGGRGGMGGMGGFDEYDSRCQIKINSSTLCIKTEGDGIDSNGDLNVKGSTVIVYGPTNGGNGSLDYAGKCITENSNLLAAGSSGMAQSVSEGSDPTVSFTCGVNAGTLLTVTDESGNDIISFCSPKQYSCVVFSSYKFQKGKTYSVYEGGTNSGSETFGIYSGEKTKNATLLGSLDAS